MFPSRSAARPTGRASRWEAATRFATRTDGTLWGWGLDFQGTLGDGGTAADAPVQIGADNHWVTVSTTDADTLAIKSDGTLWGWGNNVDGELGDGTGLPKPTPVQIGVDTHWATARVDGGSAVATKTDGTLWAWGSNGSGQLGDGTASATAVVAPERIGAGTDWAGVTTDGSSSLGVRTDGTLWAWGSNALGELGDGGTVDQHAPRTHRRRLELVAGRRQRRGRRVADRRHDVGVGPQRQLVAAAELPHEPGAGRHTRIVAVDRVEPSQWRRKLRGRREGRRHAVGLGRQQ